MTSTSCNSSPFQPQTVSKIRCYNLLIFFPMHYIEMFIYLLRRRIPSIFVVKQFIMFLRIKIMVHKITVKIVYVLKRIYNLTSSSTNATLRFECSNEVYYSIVAKECACVACDIRIPQNDIASPDHKRKLLRYIYL